MVIRRVGQNAWIEREKLAVIDAIYGAVTDPSRWPDVTRAVSRLLGGGITALLDQTNGAHKPRILAHDLDPAFRESYAAYYGGINPWAQLMLSDRKPVQVGDDRVPPAELERTEFHADWLRPQDVRFPIAVSVTVGPGQTVELATVRNRKLGPLTPAECQALVGLAPHLQRALELSRRLGLADAERAASVAATRRLGTGLILVDADRTVVFMDAEAEGILRAGGGLWVRERRLFALPSLDARLGEAIARATGKGRSVVGRSGDLLNLPRQGGALPLSLAVAPLDDRDRPLGLIGPLAMVLVSAPERGGLPSEEGLRSLFDLTPAEARLVVALCAGETLAGYASTTGTSLNTAKTHLKRAFEKTGETRQADLVRRVTSDVALRFGSPDEL
jgi:DNA-binding CsgD family transcriptional regulator